VPAARPAGLGVDVEDRLGAGERRHGGVRNERAQEPGEGLMPGFVEVALAAEKHDAMTQQGIADRGHRRSRQIAAQPYTMDFRTDRRRDRTDNQGAVGRTGVIDRRGRFRHITPVVWTWS
jgi:hypothetical protein